MSLSTTIHGSTQSNSRTGLECIAEGCALAETLPAAIFVIQNSTFRYINTTMSRLSGYSRSELLGTPFWNLVDPALQETTKARYLARQNGEVVPARNETRIVTKGGHVRLFDYNASRIHFRGEPAVLGIAYDVTDRNRPEEPASPTENRPCDARQSAGVGETVGCVAHHMKGALTRMLGSLELIQLMKAKKQPDQIDEMLDLFQRSTENLSELVQDMLTLSIARSPRLTEESINDLASEIFVEYLALPSAQAIHGDLELADDMPKVFFDRKGLSEVIENLTGNAVEACEGVNDPQIALRTFRDDKAKAVCAEVVDNGPGIPEEIEDHVFDPMFSTKGQRGNGFGLAIARKIVEEHGGTLDFNSQPGRTVFTMRLPQQNRPQP